MTALRVVIVGAGLVGASIGLALRQGGHTVHLNDKRPSHAIVAAGLGAGSAGPIPPSDVDLVVVAVPPAALAKVIAKALATYPHAVVTDVGSVKASVLAQLKRTEYDLSRYVGSHPMAGSQHTGPLTARANLFEDRTWVVTPHETSRPDAVQVVRDLATTCGSRVVELDVDEHDEAVAQVSHLPQLISSLTAGRLLDVPPDHLRLAGQGIRDVTRIAGSDPGLWRQIVAANATAVRTELAAVHAALGELLAVLDDPAAVEAFVARGREGTRALPGKHGHRATDYAHVVVEIPDAPGALARLFADVEVAEVNVEDLSIEHDDAREVGFLSIAVEPAHVPVLEAAMAAGGWTLRA
ncbi:MAG TPA: prephenate dehydrogenase [Propionibacteriaceae bacterium]|nr:prephenate dehydrogenase [Propionibacteriaceae bacterium]